MSCGHVKSAEDWGGPLSVMSQMASAPANPQGQRLKEYYMGSVMLVYYQQKPPWPNTNKVGISAKRKMLRFSNAKLIQIIV